MCSPQITYTYTLFASVSLYFNVGYGEKIVIALMNKEERFFHKLKIKK